MLVLMGACRGGRWGGCEREGVSVRRRRVGLWRVEGGGWRVEGGGGVGGRCQQFVERPLWSWIKVIGFVTATSRSFMI